MKTQNHIKALMNKNFILWKRSCCCSCLEIFIPIFLLLFLYIVRTGITETTFPETSFLNNTVFLPSEIVKDPSLGTVTKVFIKNCINSSRTDFPSYRNGKIALAPINSITKNLEQQFLNLGYSSIYF